MHLSSLETTPEESLGGIGGMYGERQYPPLAPEPDERAPHAPDHHHRQHGEKGHHHRPHAHETVPDQHHHRPHARVTDHHHRPFDHGPRASVRGMTPEEEAEILHPADKTGHHHRPFDKGEERERNPILAAIHKSARGDARIEKTMRNIYGGESGHGAHWDVGDHGESGGPFQLDTAGGRLGAQFEKTHPGMSVHDAKTLQAQSDFVAKWLREHPHTDPSKVWFGLQHPERFGNLKGGYDPGGNFRERRRDADVTPGAVGGATPGRWGALTPARGREEQIAGVDKRLMDSLAAGAAHLPPGYRVEPFSGKSATHGDPGSKHRLGQAVDVTIYDPSGRRIPNEGADTTGMYGRLARETYGDMQKRYPDLAPRFAHGAQFGTHGGSGIPDLMHYDIGGQRRSPGPQFSPTIQELGPMPTRTLAGRGMHPISGKVDDFNDFVAGAAPDFKARKRLLGLAPKPRPDEFITHPGISYGQDPNMPVIRDDPKVTAREKADYERIQRYIDAMRARKSPS
jgi:hypothetical protein